MPARRWRFGAQAQNAASAAKREIRRVVERVSLENSPARRGPEPPKFAEDCRRIGDAQFDFNFAICKAARSHA
jgi:hypothetical protein